MCNLGWKLWLLDSWFPGAFEMWVLVMVLVGYGGNSNKIEGIGQNGVVCHSDCKHLHIRLLPARHISNECEWQEISDSECCYLYLCFGEAGRD